MSETTNGSRFGGDGLEVDSSLRLRGAVRAVAALVLVATGWLSLSTLLPPGDISGVADGFSMERARADIEAIAGQPRPTGSEAHARVREYLVDAIRGAGLEAEVQEAVVPAGEPPGIHRLTRVRNVIGRLPGQGAGEAILLAAHYDSVPATPGAGDDASGVAALLETMRVMASGEPPRRDVIFLFTDAEELGLLGARAFVDAGRAQGIGWVLNFEARGAAGASLMFETLPGDVEAMRFFAKASPAPTASSYSYDIYSRMPNDTDFSVFRQAIPAGFNFGFIEDPAAYHSAVDTPDRLDEGSLRHHGVQALSLARRLAEAPPDRSGPRAVYFSLPVVGLVVYPAGWDAMVAVACGLLGLGVLGLGLARRRLVPGRCLLGLAAVVAVIGVSALGLVGLRWFWGDVLGLARATKGVLAPLAYGWLLIAVGLAWLTATGLMRRLGAMHLAVGAAVAWTGLAGGAAWLLDSSAFLFTWPALFAWAALLVGVTGKENGDRWRAPLALACALPVVVIWVPTLKGVAVALGPAAIVLGICAALPVLLLSLTVAQLAGGGPGRWVFPGLFLAAGLALFAWAAGTAGPAPTHPQPNSLVYALDAASGEAVWASYDEATDDWTRRVLGDSPRRRPLPGFFSEDLELLTGPAEALPMPAPEVTVLESERLDDGGRRLTVALRSPRQAPFLEAVVSSAGTIRSASVDGRALSVDGGFRLTYHALPPGGIRLELVLDDDGPVDLAVVDGTYGLPPAVAPRPRPSWFQPRRYPWTLHERKFPFSDTTLVRTERRLTME